LNRLLESGALQPHSISLRESVQQMPGVDARAAGLVAGQSAPLALPQKRLLPAMMTGYLLLSWLEM